MESVTRAVLLRFLEGVGERFTGEGTLYLLGGSALCLLGSSRATVDIDYMADLSEGPKAAFEAVVSGLAAEMHLDVEEVPIGEFIPIPPGARERRRMVGRYGRLDVFIFDLYSIALSKIARGFEADLDDVVFLLQQGLIEPDALKRYFNAVLPRARAADIIPSEFQQYFEETLSRYRQLPRPT